MLFCFKRFPPYPAISETYFVLIFLFLGKIIEHVIRDLINQYCRESNVSGFFLMKFGARHVIEIALLILIDDLCPDFDRDNAPLLVL